MKVSVIIAAYNIEKYINKCLESIIHQSLEEIEIIVVNDGSTDNTLEYIEIVAKKDKRVVIIDKNNEGVIEARKSGLEIARGDYILFVDADDWLEIESLELLYNKGIEFDNDIVMYNDFYSYDDDDSREKLNMYNEKKDIKENPLKNLLLGNIMPAMYGKFIKKDF